MKELIVIGILVAAVAADVSHCKEPGVLANRREICMECDTGFYLNTSDSMSICNKCFGHCADCIYLADTISYFCNHCEDGFRIDTNNTSICAPCAGNCKTCNLEDIYMECLNGAKLVDGQCVNSNSWLWMFFIVILIFIISARFSYAISTIQVEEEELTHNIMREKYMAHMRLDMRLKILNNRV